MQNLELEAEHVEWYDPISMPPKNIEKVTMRISTDIEGYFDPETNSWFSYSQKNVTNWKVNAWKPL